MPGDGGLAAMFDGAFDHAQEGHVRQQDRFAGPAVDPDIVSARICQTPAVDTDAPILILGVGREVRFYGEVFRFPKGVEQRQIIVFLHERYQQGELWVSNEAILAELNLGGTRVRDKFKKSPAWGRLLTERSGLIGFCWPDQI